MKRKWHHPKVEKDASERVWKTSAERNSDKEFVDSLDQEFPTGTGEMASEEERENSRRSFLKYMGASTALAAVGCRRPEKFIVPFPKPVEWVIPGRPTFYATSMPTTTGAVSLVATTHEGRPTHLQGNPNHPSGATGCSSFATASILDLYDPNRVQEYTQNGEASGAESFQGAVNQILESSKSDKGASLGLMFRAGVSPTRDRLVSELRKKLPYIRIYQYDPLARSEVVSGVNEKVFGKGVKILPKLAKASRILSLDADFLGLDKASDDGIASFMEGRNVDSYKGDVSKMNRLYVAENRYTQTGGMADHRLPVKSADIFAVAGAIAKHLGVSSGLLPFIPGSVLGADDWVKEVANDLLENKGKSIVLAGAHQPEKVHAIVTVINQLLGAYGSTIETVSVDSKEIEYSNYQQLYLDAIDGKLENLILSGDINPAYDAPKNQSWDTVKSQLSNIAQICPRKNDTSEEVNWVVPGTHYLESWGDVRSQDGTYGVVQPMIMPLYGGLSDVDVLLLLLGEKDLLKAEDEADVAQLAVRKTHQVGSIGKSSWNELLRDGFSKDSQFGKAAVSFSADGAKKILEARVPRAEGNYEVVLVPDSKVWDGKYIDNAWLQEAPDPITKTTWDNAAWLSPRTFRKLGLELPGYNDFDYPMIKVTVGKQSLEIPAIECPGHAHESITISLGYGQKITGQVGEGRGFNGYQLRPESGEWIADAKVEVLKGKKYTIATTAEHYSMKGRAIARSLTADAYHEDFEKKEEHDSHNSHGSHDDYAKTSVVAGLAKQTKDEKEAAEKNANDSNETYQPKESANHPFLSAAWTQGMDSHVPPSVPVYRGQTGVKGESLLPREHPWYDNFTAGKNPDGFDYEKEHQWGMSIDLNQCTGCSDCLVACQSENNIPIVGKGQVLRQREMHWIRMDRYFSTTDTVDDDLNDEEWLDELDNPEMIVQPVACVHCESAPCETVCPVNATVHTEEGLNSMTYNRCIGTRYCANNCPYKARRFNFFDYNKRNPLSKKSGPLLEDGNLYLGPLGDRADTPLSKLQKNPNVTVRMRGVMEKCTYCVQRLEEAKIDQKRIARDSANVKVPTDSVKVACQQACSAGAIEFGNMADEKSKVVDRKASIRNYNLLEYLVTLPRTSYLARVKNPNPKMKGADKIGTQTMKMH